MKQTLLSALLVLAICSTAPAKDVPQSVVETWARFDPRAEPLETELIRESIHDGIVLVDFAN